MKKIIFAITILVLASGCKKFLDLEPQSQATSENYYKTPNDFNTALVASYAKLRDCHDIYLELCEYRSDELTITAPTAGTQDRFDIDRFRETAPNALVLKAWSSYYYTILTCNVILEKVDGISMSDNLKNQYKGEASFLRAFQYFNLVRFWGDVPLILSPLGPDQALSTPRTKADAVYDAIEKDLEIAIEGLPDDHATADMGRATSGAARALLGKVQLTRKKYAAVVQTLAPLIGKYQLLPDVANVFDVANKMNKEILFAVRYNKDLAGQGHGLWYSKSDTLTSEPITASLISSYKPGDQRRNLLRFTKVGFTYVVTKYSDVLSTTTQNAGNDYILLRYADVLLMYAEAKNELGYEPTGEAIQYLNQVHTRAGLSPFTASDVQDQGIFRNTVYLERKLEFALEGQRWFDLIRTGTVIEQLLQNEGRTVPAFRLLYPIPQTEIEKIGNPLIFPQNPGY